MSLQIFNASDDACVEHVSTCDEPACQLCRDIVERWAAESTWMADRVEGLSREIQQNAELDEFDEAERRRDFGLDDNDASDFTGDDLREGDPSRA